MNLARAWLDRLGWNTLEIAFLDRLQHRFRVRQSRRHIGREGDPTTSGVLKREGGIRAFALSPVGRIFIWMHCYLFLVFLQLFSNFFLITISVPVNNNV